MGAVLDTLNRCLLPEQIAYIANPAGDRMLFADLTLVPFVERTTVSGNGSGDHHPDRRYRDKRRGRGLP